METPQIGICACGCGLPTKIVEKPYEKLGLKKGDYRKFIRGHSFKVLHKDSWGKFCKIEGCNLLHYAKGFCRMHYERTKHKNPDLTPGKIKDFNKKERNGMWRGDKVSPGTGRARARRWFKLGKCELCDKPAVDRHHKDGDTSNNDPPNIQFLCSACHAMVEGRAERATMILKQRSKKGESNPRAKLTFVQVIEMREKYSVGNISRKELGREYGISPDHVGNIVNGKRWNDPHSARIG